MRSGTATNVSSVLYTAASARALSNFTRAELLHSAPAQAKRAGGQVETVKKFNAGGNTSAAGLNAAKLDRETEELSHEKVSSELKKQIQQARLAKKMTQAQLAQQINEKPSVINDYESGKAIPNAQVLSKMSRILGVTLKKNPGKK
eukprot:CAMPEP_0117672494 /NCGR_PEP_ID=MMETSP0804-20121206/13936_1 /TAXON_ID=1074897 /ORGANISM="Tetraselmis astigmatica, Strain CCMP880" /LENGTH=145 /DNA_ID=CAMNT_0005481103 /DNA_START=204 /DNA_END=642 /DNA_ORIENTATION=+